MSIFRRHHNSQKRAFSLFETVVMVIIIGLIVSLGILSVIAIRRKARNTQRVSDIKVIQSALELYRSENRFYPTQVEPGLALLSPDGQRVYLKSVPTNPKPWNEENCDESDYVYKYLGPTSYQISFCLSDSVGDLKPGFLEATPSSFGQAAIAWRVIGEAELGINENPGGFSLLIDSNDTINVAFAYTRGPGDYGVKVLRYVNKTWAPLAPEGLTEKIPIGAGYRVTGAIDDQDRIYLIYTDYGNGSKLIAKRYSGNAWESLGYVSEGIGDLASMTLDADGVPYVAYRDHAATPTKAMTVKKYLNGSWQLVGSQGFTAAMLNNAYFPDIAISPVTGRPYVVYADQAKSLAMTVKYFNGSAWTEIDDSALNSGKMKVPPSIVVDNQDNIYVSYRNMNVTEPKGYVKKFDGSTWSFVGPSTGVTPDKVATSQLSINPVTNQLFLSFFYQVAGFDIRPMVMSYDQANNKFNELTEQINRLPADVSSEGFAFLSSGTPCIVYNFNSYHRFSVSRYSNR